MKGRRFAGALVAAALGIATLCGSAPVQQMPHFPTAVLTDLGASKLISEPDDDAMLGGVQVFLSAGLDRETPGTSGIAALTAECVLRTPVTPPGGAAAVPLRDAVADAGGSIDYTVDGRSVHFYLEGRTDALPAIVGLLGKALAAPDFNLATLAAARTSLTSRIDDLEGNALSVGVEMFRRAYFATSAGLPALGSTTTLATLASADLTAFYQANYKRGGMSASAAGHTTPALADALRTLAQGLPDGTTAPVMARAKPIPANAPRIISHRDVGAPIVIVGFAAPSPGTREFGAALVLESLLSNAFERSSATTLGLAERSVGAFYLYDSSPASLVVYVNGTRVDPSLALREVLVVAKSLAVKPLGAQALKRFKAAAEGQFITDSVNLSDRSYLLGTFAAQGWGTDSINAALGSLEQTNAADVQRVAKQYLQRYIVALVLPRQGDGG